jgi:hypothetical protein
MKWNLKQWSVLGKQPDDVIPCPTSINNEKYLKKRMQSTKRSTCEA